MQACFMLGRTYEVGGFGKYHDPALCMEYYRKSARLGCVWAKVVLNIALVGEEKLDAFGSVLEQIRDFGFGLSDTYAVAQEILNKGNVIVCNFVSVWDIGNFGCKIRDSRCLLRHRNNKIFFEEALKQKYTEAVKVFANWDMFLSDLDNFVRLNIRAMGLTYFDPKINNDLHLLKQKKYSHMGGYWLQKNGRYMWSPFKGKEVVSHLDFYRSNVKRISRSIICAIWCLRQVVHKDVVLGIAQRLWKTRKDYHLWENVIKQEGGK